MKGFFTYLTLTILADAHLFFVFSLYELSTDVTQWHESSRFLLGLFTVTVSAVSIACYKVENHGG